MNRLSRFFALGLLIVAMLATSAGPVFAWGSSGGDGSRYDQIQEKAVFFNNSGSTLSSGSVVILDVSGTGVTRNTTLGGYITTTTAADSVMVVGVTSESSCADQTPCVVVTKGPALTTCQDSTDAVTASTAVGTTATAGRCGGGTNLGIALEASGDTAASDFSNIWIWVDPTGAD